MAKPAHGEVGTQGSPDRASRGGAAPGRRTVEVMASGAGRGQNEGVMDYESRIGYEAARIHAAALYCSDGRVGEHFDDFLQNGLNLPRYDRVSLPGGPACLAGHPEATLEEKGVVDELRFLVDVHKLRKVVLIAHASCAFYSTRLQLKEPRLELVQRADLVRAAAYVHRVTGLEAIEGYYARLVEGRVKFERVEV